MENNSQKMNKKDMSKKLYEYIYSRDLSEPEIDKVQKKLDLIRLISGIPEYNILDKVCNSKVDEYVHFENDSDKQQFYICLKDLKDYIYMSYDFLKTAFRTKYKPNNDKKVVNSEAQDKVESTEAEKQNISDSLDFKNILQCLNITEAVIVALRYGLVNKKIFTIQQIADFLGMNFDDVKTILENVLLNYNFDSNKINEQSNLKK